jgi:hypothetical protein
MTGPSVASRVPSDSGWERNHGWIIIVRGINGDIVRTTLGTSRAACLFSYLQRSLLTLLIRAFEVQSRCSLSRISSTADLRPVNALLYISLLRISYTLSLDYSRCKQTYIEYESQSQ